MMNPSPGSPCASPDEAAAQTTMVYAPRTPEGALSIDNLRPTLTCQTKRSLRAASRLCCGEKQVSQLGATKLTVIAPI
jgi:hypothetical protein